MLDEVPVSLVSVLLNQCGGQDNDVTWHWPRTLVVGTVVVAEASLGAEGVQDKSASKQQQQPHGSGGSSTSVPC